MPIGAKLLKSLVDVGRLELPTPCLQSIGVKITSRLFGVAYI